jgi:hypothetical protein
MFIKKTLFYIKILVSVHKTLFCINKTFSVDIFVTSLQHTPSNCVKKCKCEFQSELGDHYCCLKNESYLFGNETITVYTRVEVNKFWTIFWQFFKLIPKVKKLGLKSIFCNLFCNAMIILDFWKIIFFWPFFQRIFDNSK